MQTETNPMWSNPHSPPHDFFPKMLNWKKINKSIQSNNFPLEWQGFCQKLLHFGPFCITLNFKGSQLWKVELIRDFPIHLSTFLFSAPCVGGVSFVVENLKRGESLKAMWLSGGGAKLIFWWSRVQALHPSMPWICCQLPQVQLIHCVLYIAYWSASG